MCYYDVIYCESCKAMTQFPPTFCDKIRSGIICTKYSEPDNTLNGMIKLCMATIYEKAYDVANGELRLYDILEAKDLWINSTICPCGSTNNSPSDSSSKSYSTADCFSDDSTYSDLEVDFNYWPNMGEGFWDNNGGSPQWVPNV